MPRALGSGDIGVQHAHPHRSWSLSSCPTWNPCIPEASQGTGNALGLSQEMQAPDGANCPLLPPSHWPRPYPPLHPHCPLLQQGHQVFPQCLEGSSWPAPSLSSFSCLLRKTSPVAPLPAPCPRPHGLSSMRAWFAQVSPSRLSSARAGAGREPLAGAHSAQNF